MGVMVGHQQNPIASPAGDNRPGGGAARKDQELPRISVKDVTQGRVIEDVAGGRFEHFDGRDAGKVNAQPGKPTFRTFLVGAESGDAQTSAGKGIRRVQPLDGNCRKNSLVPVFQAHHPVTGVDIILIDVFDGADCSNNLFEWLHSDDFSKRKVFWSGMRRTTCGGSQHAGKEDGGKRFPLHANILS